MNEERSLGRALGLPNDPFAHPAETFFAAGNRTRQLDELRQLSRGTRRLLAVTGDRGVGKSVMFRTLSSRLDPGVKAARINANLTNDLMGVLMGVLQGLGLGLPEKDKPAALADVIVDHARRQGEASRYDLVMVDDAHALELRALEALLGMLVATPQRGLRIVFFAEVPFIRALEKAVGRVASGLTWHEIRLTPFSRDEVRRYLKFRFAEVGWDDHLPFTEQQIQELIADSKGLPGAIDERVSALLGGPVDGARPAAFPALHRAVLALLLVIVGMVWLVWRHGDPEALRETLVAGVDPPPSPPATARPNRVQRELAAAAAAAAASKAPTAKFVKDGASQTDSPAGSEAVDGDATNPAAVVTVPSESHLPPQVEPEHPEPEPDPAPVSDTGEDPAPYPIAVPAASVPAPAQSDPAPVPAPAPAPAPAPEPVASEEPDLVVRPARALPLAESPAPPREAEPEAPPEPEPMRLRGGAKGVTWVMRQTPDRYTLQLFGTSDRDRLVSYVNRQEEIGEFAFLTLERDGRPWYVVTYGVFSSHAAAQAAAEALPDTVGRVNPWVRQFSAVQAHFKASTD